MLDPFTDPPTKLKEKDIINLRVEGKSVSKHASMQASK